MREILKSISELMIEQNEFEFPKEMIQKKWFGNNPATFEEIKHTEDNLNIQLPTDYKEFISICNGFHAPNIVEPTFHSIDQIKYLRDIDPDMIRIWEVTGNMDIAVFLKRSIVIAGIQEEQSFFLIPPDSGTSEWKYWKFANWIPGEEPYYNLEHYFKVVLSYMQSQSQHK